MKQIFDFTSYREYLEQWIAQQGAHSHGQKGKISRALSISSSLLSQILKGEKSLTQDHASDLCDYLGLSEYEADYLHAMVEWDRAGSMRYRSKVKKKMDAMKAASLKISKRVTQNKELTDEQKSVYYSTYLYTAVRNLTAIADLQTSSQIALYLGVDESIIHKTIKFLIDNGFCIPTSSGGVTYGPRSLHVDQDSPFVNKHHQNWRLQGLRAMENRRGEDLFFTSPMSLSEKDVHVIRKMIPNFIQEVAKIVGPSDSEKAMCLNIDWFKY